MPDWAFTNTFVALTKWRAKHKQRQIICLMWFVRRDKAQVSHWCALVGWVNPISDDLCALSSLSGIGPKLSCLMLRAIHRRGAKDAKTAQSCANKKSFANKARDEPGYAPLPACRTDSWAQLIPLCPMPSPHAGSGAYPGSTQFPRYTQAPNSFPVSLHGIPEIPLPLRQSSW
jgi:hypothetical protein